MKLYHLPYSHFSAKVRIVILEKGIDVELQNVADLDDRASFLNASPSALVPCLVSNDATLSESEVIVEYLDERFADPRMLPNSPSERAQSRWLSRLHDLYIAPQLSALFGVLQAEQPDADAKAHHLGELERWLQELESQLNPAPYVFGEQFGLVDASYALSLWYAQWLAQQLGQPLSREQLPNVFTWFAALVERPSIKVILEDCWTALGISEAQSMTGNKAA